MTHSVVGRALSSRPDALTEYLNSIGRYHLLSRVEEATLGRRIRAGDMEAANELVCANLRFVVSMAAHYQGRGVSLLDLIDEGNLGLIRAARRFDERRGIRFISYAVWWIRQALFQAIAEQSRIVRVPLNRTGALHRIGKRVNSLFQQLGREPTHEEIADELELTEDEVVSALTLSSVHLSLDAPTTQSDDDRLLEHLSDEVTPSPDEETFRHAVSASISEALHHLREREAEILRLYFGLDGEEPMTLEEIGARFDITRERARQIRDRALRKLRRALPELAQAG